MSTIPHAKSSLIESTTIHPPRTWSAHPIFEYSTANSCYFSNLDSNSRIERSKLRGVSILHDELHPGEAGNAATRIERSEINTADLKEVTIERSQITDSCVRSAKVERCVFLRVNVDGFIAQGDGPQQGEYAKRSTVSVSSSHLTDTEVAVCSPSPAYSVKPIQGPSQGVSAPKIKVERCNINASYLLASTASPSTSTSKVPSTNPGLDLERTNITASFISTSKLSYSNISNCDISHCKIERTNFEGKFVRNGVWERGTLVGRIDESQEVIVKDLSEVQGAATRVQSRSETRPVSILRSSSQASHVPAPVVRVPVTASRQEEVPRVSEGGYEGPDLEDLPPYQA